MKIFGYAAVLFVLSRAWYILLLALWVKLQPTANNFTALFSQWDSGWYLSIMENGYHAFAPGDYTRQANWVFFPLYPLLSYCVTLLTGLWKEWSGLIVSNLCLWGALVVSAHYYLRSRCLTKLTDVWPLWFLLTLGSYSFYFGLIYTEALFVFLTALGFYYLQERSYLSAALIGGFLSATRNVGIIFCVVILVQYGLDYWRRTVGLRANLKRLVKNRWRTLLTIIGLASSGLLVFTLFLQIWMGDGFAWLKTQKAWERSFLGALDNLHANYTTSELWWLGGVIILALLVLLWAWQHNRRWGEVIFASAILILPLLSSFWSLPRYLVGCLPFLCLSADGLRQLSPLPRRVLFFALATINVYLLYAWFGQERLVM
jgi:hypothetical protein